jgi:hypothetical protein
MHKSTSFLQRVLGGEKVIGELGNSTTSIFLQTTRLQSKVARVEERKGELGSSTTTIFFSTFCSQRTSASRLCL